MFVDAVRTTAFCPRCAGGGPTSLLSVSPPPPVSALHLCPISHGATKGFCVTATQEGVIACYWEDQISVENI